MRNTVIMIIASLIRLIQNELMQKLKQRRMIVNDEKRSREDPAVQNEKTVSKVSVYCRNSYLYFVYVHKMI